MTQPSAVPLHPTSLTHAEIRTIIIGIGIAMFLSALDQTIIATALPTIARELNDFNNISWVASIYLLSATAVTPLYGKFSDIHGRRVTLLMGIVIFVIGSVACALAPTMLVLIGARALQGLGGGGLISMAQTIVADIVAPKERGRYQVYIAGVFLSASLLGPLLGGILTEHLHWSFIFWINLPLGLIAYAMTSNTLKRLPRHDRPHQLDVLGAILLVIATVSLMLALSEGGVIYPWLSEPILLLVGASLLFWGLFGWRIMRAAEPLIPPDILAHPVVAFAIVAACFSMGAYVSLSIYMPVYFESVRGLSASDSGLALIPLMLGTVIGATMAGQVMSKLTHYKRLPIGGLLVAMVGSLVLVLFDDHLSLIAFEGVLALISIGLGTVLPTTTVAIQNAVMPHQLGTATGTMNFFRQLGSSLLVAGFGAILLNAGAHKAEGHIDIATGKAAFFYIFLASFIGFALSFIALLAMKEEPLRSGAKHAAEAVTMD